MPKISVCIPTFNRSDLLRQAIDSVLAQDMTDWELIISDNASTDATPSIVAGYHDPRIRSFRQSSNIGMAGNFNAAIRQTKGKYVKMLMDDDVLWPSCLRRQTDILDLFPDVAVVCSDYIAIDAVGNQINDIYFHRNTFRIFPTSRQESGASFILEYLLGHRSVGLPSAVTFRRSSASDLGFFDEHIGNPLDADLWMRLCRQGDFYYLDEHLLSMRWHDNASRKYASGPFGYRDIFDLAIKHYQLNAENYLIHQNKNKIFQRVASLMMLFYYRAKKEERVMIKKDFLTLPLSMFQRWLSIMSYGRYVFLTRASQFFRRQHHE